MMGWIRTWDGMVIWFTSSQVFLWLSVLAQAPTDKWCLALACCLMVILLFVCLGDTVQDLITSQEKHREELRLARNTNYWFGRWADAQHRLNQVDVTTANPDDDGLIELWQRGQR